MSKRLLVQSCRQVPDHVIAKYTTSDKNARCILALNQDTSRIDSIYFVVVCESEELALIITYPTLEQVVDPDKPTGYWLTVRQLVGIALP